MKRQECEQLTLFPEVSPANLSPAPGSNEAQRMTAISGRKCSELYASCGPVGSLVRMLLESSIWRSTRCLLTWKAKVTPRGRLYYQLAASMRRTGDTALQSWPTPRASSGTGPSMAPHRQGGADLQTAAVLYPTPTTKRLCGGSHALEKLKAMEAAGQITEAERRSMAAGNGGQLNPDWVEWLMGFPPGWTRV